MPGKLLVPSVWILGSGRVWTRVGVLTQPPHLGYSIGQFLSRTWVFSQQGSCILNSCIITRLTIPSEFLSNTELKYSVVVQLVEPSLAPRGTLVLGTMVLGYPGRDAGSSKAVTLFIL